MSSRNIYVHTVVLMLATRVITTHPTAMIYHRTIYVILIQSLSLSHFPPVSIHKILTQEGRIAQKSTGWGKWGKTGDFVEKFYLEKYRKKTLVLVCSSLLTV